MYRSLKKSGINIKFVNFHNLRKMFDLKRLRQLIYSPDSNKGVQTDRCKFVTFEQRKGTCWISSVINLFRNTNLAERMIPREPNETHEHVMSTIKDWAKQESACPYYKTLGNDLVELYKLFWIEYTPRKIEKVDDGTKGGYPGCLIRAILCACNIDATYFGDVYTIRMDGIEYFLQNTIDMQWKFKNNTNLHYIEGTKTTYLLYERRKLFCYGRQFAKVDEDRFVDKSSSERKEMVNTYWNEYHNHYTEKEDEKEHRGLRVLNFLELLCEENPHVVDKLFAHYAHKYSTNLWISQLSMPKVKISLSQLIPLIEKSIVDYGTMSLVISGIGLNPVRKDATAAFKFILGKDVVDTILQSNAGNKWSSFLDEISLRLSGNHAISFTKCDEKIMFCNSWGRRCNDYRKLEFIVDYVSSCLFFVELTRPPTKAA